MPDKIEFGLDTFGDVTLGPDGKPLSHAQVLRNVIEEAALADSVGVDAFGVGEPVTWKGRHYPALNQQRPYPRTESGRLAVSIGVGGSPESVVRAARYGLPLTLAIIGGDPRRFLPYIALYYESLEQLGHER